MPWIKLEYSTIDKPEMLRMAALLSATHEVVFAAFVRFLMWADSNTADGLLPGVDAPQVDYVARLPGFSDAMVSVGWLQFTDQNGAEIPNFDRHNGKSAKRRALNAKYKQTSRERQHVSKRADIPLTREEKRREEEIHASQASPAPHVATTAAAEPAAGRGRTSRRATPVDSIAWSHDPGWTGIEHADREAWTQIVTALRRLPARQREAFTLRVLEELDVADTARIMGCSEGSVKTHLSRARDALQKQLEVSR